MTVNKTYGYIKKRILDALDENTGTNEVFVSDGNRQLLLSRMPGAVTSSFIRMYESLPVGRKSAVLCAEFFDNISRKENEKYTFTSKSGNVVVVAGVFGEGNICVVSEGEEKIECRGGAELSFVRFSNQVESGKKYTVFADENVTLKSLAVYELSDGKELFAYPPEGFCSVKLPIDFDRFICVNGKECEGEYPAFNENLYSYFPENEFEKDGVINAIYCKKVPVITGETSDETEFDISPLEAEALINLSASELCREHESSLYSRLFYKYNDLSEGLRCGMTKSKRVNRFFKSKRRGW